MRKYSLFTLLLVVTIVALSFAWNVQRLASERRLREQEKMAVAKRDQLSQRYEELLAGMHDSAESWRLVTVAEAFKVRKTDDEFLDYLRSELVWAMRSLWSNEGNISAAMAGERQATSIGRDILDVMDCTTVSEFFDIARSSDGFSDENAALFPEINNRNSSEYASFHDFVQRSFQEIGGIGSRRNP